MSVCYENTLSHKVISDESDEHQLPIVFCVLSVGLNELRDCTTHQVGLVDLVGVTDVGHLIFEDFRHFQASLVWMFLHRRFLSSFRILETIRLTVSRIRCSFGLLDKDLFLRPHKCLESGSWWSFFMGYPPVQSSLQEYLGVLVHDPVKCVSSNILKGSHDGVGLS
jgi:hypothetical protein